MARVLIVEDEPLIALMLADWLEEAGHASMGPVGTVPDALEFLQRERPDVALLDLHLGRERSDPVAERLMAMNIRFAVATGDSAGASEAGFGNHIELRKPYDFDQFTAIMAKLTA